MKQSIDKFFEKLKPYKDFLVKYSRTIYFVLVAFIIGFLLVRVTTIILSQAPPVDISEDTEVKGVKTIKAAKAQVYAESLKYCDKTDTACINTQINRLLVNIADSTSTLELKPIGNNYDQFKAIDSEISSIKEQLKPIIADGTYSDSMSAINNLLNFEAQKNDETYNNAYQAVMVSPEKSDAYTNTPIDTLIEQIKSIRKDTLSPTREKISNDYTSIEKYKTAVLKEQKANINSVDTHSTRFLIKNPDMPLLILPYDIQSTANQQQSIYSILRHTNQTYLTDNELNLELAVSELRNDVKIVTDKNAELNDKVQELKFKSNNWINNINKVLATSSLLSQKSITTKNNDEKAVLDKFTNLNKLVKTIQKPYSENITIIEKYSDSINTYVTGNSDDPVALKLLNPNISQDTNYDEKHNPFSN